MKSITLPSNVTRALYSFGFKIKKHSPEILVTTGVIGMVASGVMACKATTKVDAIMSKTKNNVEIIHEGMETGAINGEEYTVEDGKKDLAIVYTKTGLDLVKLYGPAILLATASAACIFKSHSILRTRNVALAAAYTAVDQGFKDYRGRVIERFGEELDRELRYNIKSKEVEEVVTNEDGTETTVKKVVDIAEPNNQYSIYARCFDETCTGWERDAEYNLTFLKQQEKAANDRLKSRKVLTLNEVYDMLGMQRSKAGVVVGWVYDEDNMVGDNYVDFGIHEMKTANKRFVNGYEKSIWLDFNVDGNVYELMH